MNQPLKEKLDFHNIFIAFCLLFGLKLLFWAFNENRIHELISMCSSPYIVSYR